MDQRPSLCDLPPEIINMIFSYLDYKDLKNCKSVCRRLNTLSKFDRHWEIFCQKYFLVDTCPYGMTWEERFNEFHENFGKYIHCYAHIKRTWDRIITFYRDNCPPIHETIKAGTTEEHLDQIEHNLDLQLPADFRCSYRLHNGQRLTSPGLLGSVSMPGHYRSESLLDLDTILVSKEGRNDRRNNLSGCIPVTLCLHTGLSHYLAVNDEDGYEPNTVFFPVPSMPIDGRKYVDAFIAGTSFMGWLTEHADHLENEDFVIIQNQPFRYIHEPDAVETTENITISVATSFLPELSTINPPLFTHSYRISMEMSQDAKDMERCQLESRHWVITDETGNEEQVDGPGVVGEYPVMYPGAAFSWISATSFPTTYGNMRGLFRMRNILTSDRLNIKCPTFHMKCLPYIHGKEREDSVKHRSSSSEQNSKESRENS